MQTMLIMNINPELEEDMVDYLLEQEYISGFTSYKVSGHGAYSNMSLAEQVSGRRKRVQLEVLLKQGDVSSILEGLKSQVGVDIVYWEQPISNHGRID
jgi:nitrogen regulatory protein PII